MSDDCARAMLRLREELSGQWPRRIFYSGAENISVLSLSPELTVWCLDGVFIWNDGTRVVRYPLGDVRGAADHLLGRAADTAGSGDPSGRSAGDDIAVRSLAAQAASAGHDGGQSGQLSGRPESVGA